MSPASRDIGLKSPGAGKGDAPRHKLDDQYRRNFDFALYGCVWSEPVRGETISGFVRLGNKLRKVYR